MKIEQIAPNALQVTPLIRPVLDLYAQLPGRKRIQDRKLLVEASPENLRYMIDKIPKIVTYDLPCINSFLGITEGNLVVPMAAGAASYEYKTQPYAHQKEAFAASRHAEYYALFMEMGTGKTWVFLQTGFSLFVEGHIDIMLVFAPIGVHRQWVTEQLPAHAPDSVPYEAFAWSRRAERSTNIEDLERVIKKSDKFRIFVVGYDSTTSPKTQRRIMEFMNSGRCLVVWDESHKLKNRKAARTVFAEKVAAKADYRRIGTGTEVTEGAEDLFAQTELLKSGLMGHNSFYGFRSEFCDTEPASGGRKGAVKITGYRNLDKLRNRLRKHTYFALKKDCLDLPEKVYVKRSVPLTDEQRTAYNELRSQMITVLQTGDEASVEFAATMLIRLQQITSGHIPDDNGTMHELETNRPQAVLDILEESKTAIIWARFIHDIESLRDKLRAGGYRVGCYYGKTKTEDRAKMIVPGAVDVLICNQQSAAAGLNLMHFNTAIYYSNAFNAADRWQSEDRIHRIGQAVSCTYVDLVSPGTVDAKILRALRSKKNIADVIRSGDAFLDLLADEDEE